MAESPTELQASLIMEQTANQASWFANPVYMRYWQHYQQAMAWHQRHRRAYQKALESAYGPGCPQRYADWHARASKGRAVAARRRRRSRRRVPAEEADSEDEESSSDSEIECDVSNMEITEELRQFFAQTEKHREELKKQQQMEAEQHGGYMPADRDLHRVSSWQRGAPSERPGERRGAEMKKLYGEDAAKIQAMEAAMQLTFDRNCDRKQPKYWPVIPLKL
ncbi:gem-associated protein 8 [Diretmus argenteus]